MAVLNEDGYLDNAYLSPYSYMSGQIVEALSTQVEMKINKEASLSSQVFMYVGLKDHTMTQVDMKIVDKTAALRTQVDMSIDYAKNISTQVEMLVTPIVKNHMQVTFGKLGHYICGGYLDEIPYLTTPYLAERFCAHQHTQVKMRIISAADDKYLHTQVNQIITNTETLHVQTEMHVHVEDPLSTQVKMRVLDFEKTLHTQVNRKIRKEKLNHTQVKMRIEDKLKDTHFQVNMLKAKKLNVSVNFVIYNITQMRILCDFLNRGIPALNGLTWTSVQAIRAGDFSPNNLNTDIIEERTETNGVIALWQLRCNTGNLNSFVDTIAILNHNFTRSASVEVSGSDDPSFSTIKFSYAMVTELENMYYIADTLPNIPAQYYQFTIQDPGNAAGSLSIGTILFGSATILTRKEQFVNPVSFGKKHYKDSLETEGFTSVSNDRATRRFLNLTFEQLIMDGGNYRALMSYMDEAKTDHKCLIIPRPTKPSRLAVFAKMSQLPEQQHYAVEDNNWRVTITFDWDESL
jgi:hypothetical protein